MLQLVFVASYLVLILTIGAATPLTIGAASQFSDIAAATPPFGDHSELDRDWELFQSRNGKDYESLAQTSYRRVIWEKNLDIIKRHNVEYSIGLHGYTMGMNKFGDMTADEFIMHALERRHEVNSTRRRHDVTYAKDLPQKVDWRQKGYVTGVKDQGRMGSSSAFGATGSIEGQMFNKTGKLVSLSAQNIADCAGPFTGHAGLMDYAFQYVIDNGGLDSAACYPARRTWPEAQCMYNASCNSADVVSFTDIPTGDERALQQAVATVGPVSVGIDASSSSFQFYSSGIYDSPICRSDQLNLGVLAVGYGTMDGKDYWLVKNSWGVSWGNQGYIMMSRNKNNQCGIATAASYPLS